MSGIAGVWYLDGRPARPVDLKSMLHPLSHRGPDGEGTWCQGSAALGHRLLQTTPESIGERMPLVSRDGSLVLTADARIDNRADLMRALGWRTTQERSRTDSELILRSYERWGVRCTHHLVGDFAFVLWDAQARHLFCARDHFGVKPFYYTHQPGRLFGFASEIKGLLGLKDIPRRLNETRVGDYLQCSFDDREITFYDGILRLPPAHTLLATPAGITITRYWSLDPYRELLHRSDAEYAEGFREAFNEAVRCRLRSAFALGSSLSGGLDSSSIVCTARKLLTSDGAAPLHTYSLVFDDLPQCDERPFIDAVLSGGDLVPHLIRGDQLSPFEDLDTYLSYEDEPSWVFNMCLHWAMHRAAAEQGVRVFLDGLGGDEAVCHGVPRLTELMRAGRLPEVAISAVRLGRHFHRSPMRILKRHAVRPLLPDPVLRGWRALRGRPTSTDRAVRPLIARELADRISLTERLRQHDEARPDAPDNVRGSHYLALVAGIMSAGFESIDRVAAAFSIEPRYPFLDKRLVEYCLALPSQQKFRRGWTRMVLRRAMAGTLPETVRWRGGKADLSAQFNEGLLAFGRERIDSVMSDDDSIAAYVDVALLRDLYRDYATGSRPQNAEQIWFPVMLALWLKRAGFARQQSGKLTAAVA